MILTAADVIALHAMPALAQTMSSPAVPLEHDTAAFSHARQSRTSRRIVVAPGILLAASLSAALSRSG